MSESEVASRGPKNACYRYRHLYRAFGGAALAYSAMRPSGFVMTMISDSGSATRRLQLSRNDTSGLRQGAMTTETDRFEFARLPKEGPYHRDRSRLLPQRRASDVLSKGDKEPVSNWEKIRKTGRRAASVRADTRNHMTLRMAASAVTPRELTSKRAPKAGSRVAAAKAGHGPVGRFIRTWRRLSMIREPIFR